MSKRTYRVWLRAQRHRDDRVGDIAREVAREGTYQVTTPSALVHHILAAHGGYHHAIDAAHAAGVEYMADES
ncbi:hypothetical protein [Janibacter sp. G1551]|uniref:hypothetical protein n=1 Tax=Janibacter sp. G1551 TaxID=3420440 RepID=UPI003D0637E8